MRMSIGWEDRDLFLDDMERRLSGHAAPPRPRTPPFPSPSLPTLPSASATDRVGAVEAVALVMLCVCIGGALWTWSSCYEKYRYSRQVHARPWYNTWLGGGG